MILSCYFCFWLEEGLKVTFYAILGLKIGQMTV